MKAGSLLDDNVDALRESRTSPSSGEVCLEVSKNLHAGHRVDWRFVGPSLCLHLFF